MGKAWSRFAAGVKRFFERLWTYSGTLAAMSLLVGTLGMGVYHLSQRVAEGELAADESRMEYFLGVANSAGAELPRGLDPLPEGRRPPSGNVLRFEYGSDGRLMRLLYLDPHGRPAPMPGSSVAEQRLSYDAEGRLTRKENLNAVGKPVADASGVSVREFGYDGLGRLARVSFRDSSGQGIVPSLPGYATALTSYDESGRPLRIEYQDAYGKPIVNAAGESCVEYTYDDECGRVTRMNRVNGELADNAHGYAVERRVRTQDGSTIRLSWETAAGRPARHPEWAAASVLTEFSTDGRAMRERYCGEDGVMLENERCCAEKLTRSNADGSMLWECYNAADGLPCMNPDLGYAERLSEYSPESELLRETFWDERGNPAPCYEKRYIREEGRAHVLSLHADGSTSYSPVGE